MGVQISVRDPAFSSSGCIPRSGIAGLDGTSRFCFLRNFQTVVYSDFASCHSHHPPRTGFRFLHVLTDTCYFLRGGVI